MATATLKKAAITRTGFEYQDLVGVEVLINFFRDPKLYQWVELESEEPHVGYLDDVVAARTDGRFEYIQVKFTPDPDTYMLGWDWLLERRPRGTSRLKKWSSSLHKIAALGPVHVAQLRTNRRPDPEFQNALDKGRIRIASLAADRRRQIEDELGGARAAQAFFKTFRFSHSEHADAEDFERQLKGNVVPTDTTSEGWLLLRQQVRRWASHKNQPEPDGKIRHDHLVQIITKRRPKPIPQNFLVPDVYAIPSRSFHDGFLRRVTSRKASVTALWGTPGRGKSTYLSFLTRALTEQGLPVIRHHYFLSLEDTTSDRISFSDIAQSLMYQMTARYPEAVKKKGLEEDPNQLRKWIEACGAYFLKQGKRFFIVIDGLDHVWREQLNIDQMNHLFSYLLPCPKNVALIVGTQRVHDHQLPLRLLTHAQPSDWIEIPAMDERAVHEWIQGQDKAGRVRFDERPRNKYERKAALDAVSNALFQTSNGHPLHLIYSFETLVRRGAPITPDEVKLLPRCPEGDIRKYYTSVWRRLKPQGKQVLHLIAGADFRWPADGLRRCAGSIDEVDHLLEHRRTGIMPFHGSILAFAREQPGHDSSFRALLPKIVRWLDREAPEFWRWGWLWITKARNGKEADLLGKPTRKWVLESLAAGWPDTQIVAVLRDAERRAFAQHDYCRAIELRSLRIRVQNGREYQTHRYPEFIEGAIRTSCNHQQALNMADDLASLTDEEIVALARSLPDELSAEIGGECVEELRRRVNLWIALRHRPDNEFVALTRHFFEALARHGQFNSKKTLNFIEGFRDGDDVFRSCLASLVQTSNLDALFELHSLLDPNKRQHWRAWVEEAIVRVAALEGVDLSTRITSAATRASPLMCCWLVLHGKPCPPTQSFTFDSALLVRERHEYGSNPALQKFFHDMFFSALATYRGAAGEFSFVLPGVDETKLGWMRHALSALREVAKGISDGTFEPSFAAPYRGTQVVEPVIGRRSTEADSTQYWAFKAALRQIATDLHLITREPPRGATIGIVEFSCARSSRHWDDAAWLADNLDARLPLLEQGAAAALSSDLAGKEANTITVFNERAERWIELSLFALLYDLPDRRAFVRRAADCIVAYSFHKDTYIYEVLDSLLHVHRSRAMSVMPLLKKIGPIVDRISDITDGDEVGGAPSEFIELLAEVCPEKLPDSYAYYTRTGKWSLAEEVLEAHTKLLTFDDPVSRALARTFLQRRDVLMLAELRDQGRAGAEQVFADQERFVGGVARSHKIEHGSSHMDDLRRGGKPPNVRKFAPTKFKQLVECVSDAKLGYELRDEALVNWIHYWKERGKGLQAINAIENYFKDNDRTYPAEHVLDDAFLVSLAVQGKKAAYKWLVRSHIHGHGWQSYWTSEKNTVRRLELAAKHYKPLWQGYIQDTSKSSRYWERRNYGFAIGLKYLVRFLLLVDQRELAAKYAETLTRILIDEMSDQPLPRMSWLQ